MKWQPIETAPRGKGPNDPENISETCCLDAPDLLLTDGESIFIGEYYWFYEEFFNGIRVSFVSGWRDCHGIDVEPTHWMALPEPPAKENG